MSVGAGDHVLYVHPHYPQDEYLRSLVELGKLSSRIEPVVGGGWRIVDPPEDEAGKVEFTVSDSTKSY